METQTWKPKLETQINPLLLVTCRAVAPPHVFPATEEPEPGGYVMQAAKLLTLAREACEG